MKSKMPVIHAWVANNGEQWCSYSEVKPLIDEIHDLEAQLTRTVAFEEHILLELAKYGCTFTDGSVLAKKLIAIVKGAE